jgi:fluoride ion exporter CrcB/FEX
MNVEYSGSFVDPGATWNDNIDGAGTIGAYNSGTLDINTLGTYTIGYVYVDAAGNTGSSERTVNVVDMTAPVLTLSGFSPELVLSGGVFFDEGADWTDNIDGSGVIANYNSGTLDVNNTGAYLISYVYVDAAGNTGTVDRLVIVDEPDTTPPVVSLSGSSPVIIFSGWVFVDEGATWTDNWDGSGVIANYNSGTLDVNNTGSYLVSYIYVDMTGNTGSVDRVVNVVEPDVTPPVVTVSGEVILDIEYGESFGDSWATWIDNLDGTGEISSYNSGVLDLNTLGTYILSYFYVDTYGNTGSADRTVNVVDTTSPVVTLSGSNPYIIFTGWVFIDEWAHWTDARDGSGVIASFNSGSVDVNNSGTYILSYIYADAAGNTGSVDRVVNVVEPDSVPPVVTFFTNIAVVNTEIWWGYSDDGAFWNDNIDGFWSTLMGLYGSTWSFTLSGTVDTNTLWMYFLEYLKVDTSWNSGKIMRVVNVVDTSMPETIVETKIWQPDPSYTGTALYSVVFSEPIDGATFTSWSISFSWSSATGLVVDSINEVAPFDGRNFEVGVSAMSTWSIVVSIRWTSEVYGTTGDTPEGLTIDGSGNIYTVNHNDKTVTKITPLGVSSTLGTTGNQPSEIVVDESGNVYTVNSADNNVTKITPLGVSSVFGTAWLNPVDLVLDGSGNIYTADYWDDTVTKITPLGVSSVFATTGDGPNGITIDGSGNLYTSNDWDNTITKITPLGVASLHATLDAPPNGIVVDGAWNTYSILYNNIIVKITPLGVSSIHW